MKKALLFISTLLIGCGEGSSGNGDNNQSEQTPSQPASIIGSYRPSTPEPADSLDSTSIFVLPNTEFFLIESTRSLTPSDELPTRLDVHHGSLVDEQSFSSRFIRYFEMDDGEEGVSSLSSTIEEDKTINIALRTGILVPGSYADPPTDDGVISGYRISRFMFLNRSIIKNTTEVFGTSVAEILGSHSGSLKSGLGRLDATLAIHGDGHFETTGLEENCSLTGLIKPSVGAFTVELVFDGSGCSLVPAQSMHGILIKDNGYLMIIAFDDSGRNPVYFGSSLQ